ncbi:hypothetical protein BC937DRAFT_93800 [Endogone sp. FLAS-F59071]|nr:hypothetical protein BC937DRAFT_93800 [Endogone sp. FLAS-F59071]|eukprot:RUS21034.1 hypothetical protein BC937DRAFT_93800 [Endogone sp. FLAS-F59071]
MSLILARRAPARESRTTLVVAPLALIRQWESEILTKTEPKSLSVYVHHGPNRTKGEVKVYNCSRFLISPSSPTDPKKLQRFDVVITTYQVVASEWPKQVRKKKDDGKANDDNSKGKDKGKSDSDDDDFTSDGDSGDKLPKAKAAKGTLFQATYYRVVLGGYGSDL